MHDRTAYLPFFRRGTGHPGKGDAPENCHTGHVIKFLLVKLRDVVKIRARFAMQNTDNQLFRSDIPGPHKSFVARKPRTKERGYPSNH
jgi:hypothetical protein